MGAGQTDGDQAFKAWTVALIGGAFNAELRFDNDVDAELDNSLMVLGVTWRSSPQWSFTFTTGAGLGGTLEVLDRSYDVSSGPFVGLQAHYRLLADPVDPVSLSFGLALAASFLRAVEQGEGTDEAPLTAIDARLSMTVSRTLWRIVTPYFSARAFGGPVFWRQDGEDRTGSDPKHVQLAIGASVAPIPELSLSVEWAFFGERGVFGAAAVSF